MIQPAINFTEPAEPDVLPIVELHRGNDGWIAFQRKNALGQFESIGSVPARELPEIFREFVAPLVNEEGFFSINAMYRPGYGQSKIEPKLHAAKWGTKESRWLTACYADFDFYKHGLTIGQALGMIVDLQENGAIPAASMLTRSGRGLWAWWFLRDEDGDGPARAWSENVACYKRIERQITRTMEAIEPDRGARDVARITRVPGSLHRITQTRVGYWIQRDTAGRPFLYTLPELAVRFGVAPPRFSEGLQRVLNPKLQERARRGYAALWRSRLERFIKLVSSRGKIQEGCRSRAALLLATFMHRCGIEESEINDIVVRFGQHQCEPRMDDVEILLAIQKRKEFAKWSDATIADWLKITPTEAAETGWPSQGSGKSDADSMLRTRADARNARREIIRNLHANPKQHPTLRSIQEALERSGIVTTVSTIRTDLTALGIENPRAWGRSRKDEPLLLPTPAE